MQKKRANIGLVMGVVAIFVLVANCGPQLAGKGEVCSPQIICAAGLRCANGLCQQGASMEDKPEKTAPDERSTEPIHDAAPEPPRESTRDELPMADAIDASVDEATPEVIAEPEPESQTDADLPEPTPDSPAPEAPSFSFRIQAIRVSHDDGTRQASISPAQVAQWVAEANKVFQSAKLSFQFDPTKDFADIKSTLLNQIEGHQFPDWQQAVAEGNKIAAKYADKFVVYFRYGRGSNPTGGGFGWTDYNFLIMPGFDNTFVCSHQNITLFAHELGHYLGLRHTFQQTYKTIADAQSAWDAAKDPAVFDGDGLVDTAPDAFTEELQCSTATQITLSGQTLPIPRDNIMSYHDSKQKTLLPQQSAIVRQVALLRNKQKLEELVPGATLRIEGETLKVDPTSQGNAAAQSMLAFHGRWSQDAHLWWAGAAPPARLMLSFPISTPGRYRVYAIFTKASDFGTHIPQINGKDTISIDLYSKYVFHTSPIDLGVHNLQASNTLIFVPQGKHTASRGYGIGIDALLFTPAP